MILGNVFKRFIGLIPKPPRVVGVVIASHGSDEYSVELQGGGVLRVMAREDYNLGNRVYVVDQRIEGLARSLPIVTIDV